MPIMALSVSSSLGGMIARMRSSTCATSFSVSSMRVPDRRAEVQLHQAGVDRREEVVPDDEHQRQADEHDRRRRPAWRSAGARARRSSSAP